MKKNNLIPILAVGAVAYLLLSNKSKQNKFIDAPPFRPGDSKWVLEIVDKYGADPDLFEGTGPFAGRYTSADVANIIEAASKPQKKKGGFFRFLLDIVKIAPDIIKAFKGMKK